MLNDTPSPSIHVWVKSQDGRIDSFEMENPKTALLLHNSCNASLYFRASQDLHDFWIPGISNSLGLNFGSLYIENQGEIETFIAKEGNKTDWHFDMMENL